MSAPVLSVKDLRVQFKTGKKTSVSVVRGVSFELWRGKTLCIVGESGCGKSVTAQSLMRLLPRDTATISGDGIMLGDCDILSLSEKEMRSVRGNRIAMIFQEPMSSLNPVYTIEHQMTEMILACRSVSRGEAGAQALELLKKVGIPEPERRLREFPHQMSGGMIQRVMIAMALSANPEILIADEPTTALDVTIQAQVMDLIARLRDEMQTAVLLITHDMGVVAEMADEVLVMYAGEVVERAPVAELFKNPRHPYTKRLLKALPRLDRDVDELYSIEGTVPSPSQEIPGCRFAERCGERLDICGSCPPELIDCGGAQVRCHLFAGGESLG